MLSGTVLTVQTGVSVVVHAAILTQHSLLWMDHGDTQRRLVSVTTLNGSLIGSITHLLSSAVNRNAHMGRHATRVLKIGQHDPSPYGRLKREPADHCISTAEAVCTCCAIVCTLSHQPDLLDVLCTAYCVSLMQCGDSTTVPSYVTPAIDRIVYLQYKHAEDKAKRLAAQRAQQQHSQ